MRSCVTAMLGQGLRDTYDNISGLHARASTRTPDRGPATSRGSSIPAPLVGRGRYGVSHVRLGAGRLVQRIGARDRPAARERLTQLPRDPDRQLQREDSRMDANRARQLVLGAGVVGLSTALYLQRSGTSVTVHRSAAAGRRHVVRQLGADQQGHGGADRDARDARQGSAVAHRREGPLRVGRRVLLPRLPWLLRWIDAGRMPKVYRISDAMRALHRDALDVLARTARRRSHFADLIRPAGQMRIWEGEGSARRSRWTCASATGSSVEQLDREALLELYPEIAPLGKRGMLLPGNACTINPRRLVRTLGGCCWRPAAASSPSAR